MILLPQNTNQTLTFIPRVEVADNTSATVTLTRLGTDSPSDYTISLVNRNEWVDAVGVYNVEEGASYELEVEYTDTSSNIFIFDGSDTFRAYTFEGLGSLAGTNRMFFALPAGMTVTAQQDVAFTIGGVTYEKQSIAASGTAQALPGVQSFQVPLTAEEIAVIGPLGVDDSMDFPTGDTMFFTESQIQLFLGAAPQPENIYKDVVYATSQNPEEYQTVSSTLYSNTDSDNTFRIPND